MARKIKKSKLVQTSATNSTNGDFNLNDKFYEQHDSFEVYSTEKKITKVFGLKDKKGSDEPYIKARSRSKTPRGWRFIYGIDLHTSEHVSRLVRGVLFIAKKFGWEIKPDQDLDKLKSQLRNSEETIIRLEKSNSSLREKHEELMIAFRTKQEEVLKSRVVEFEQNIDSLRKLINEVEANKVSEQDLQLFLYNHSWLFGTEYVNAEPQKLRGAHSKFDFYLERFNKTNDIVEIKLASEKIINKDGSLSAKVSQAIDQLIDYMESSQASAHSRVISEEEGIKELRPRGIVVIGNDLNPEAKNKLHKWNYQFAHITVLTYTDVLKRANVILGHLKNN